ncbi:hypothetical protein O3M35_010269 [Rhynocoris fuscipes]|uniref:Uncharacterized protein n=1 Tax=Rhynocoris fuscipes TaxID=488301 RepID=A0AAW1D148_9HEMI
MKKFRSDSSSTTSTDTMETIPLNTSFRPLIGYGSMFNYYHFLRRGSIPSNREFWKKKSSMESKKNSHQLAMLHLEVGSGQHHSSSSSAVPSVTITAPADQHGTRRFSFSGLNLRRLSITNLSKIVIFDVTAV